VKARRWWWRAQAYDGKPGLQKLVVSLVGAGAFDELVIGDPCWLHLEAMDRDTCYLGIGERKWMIRIDKNGEPHMGEEYA
jgi:hypothetical protein